MKNNILKYFALLLMALSYAVTVCAQKLPGIQKTSVRAPSNIRVDGKANEWSNKMQAYNPAVQAFYTVANDDKRLYLTVRADKREIINKIINGGVSFSINKNDKKSTEGAVTVTYPIFARGNRPMINFNNLSDALADLKDIPRRDSVMLGCNNTLEEKAKYIRVNNVPDVDTLLSIYNLDGVKAKSGFDDKLVYTVELAIDLKLLNIAAANLNHFNYNIRLNAVATEYIPGVNVERNEAGIAISTNVDPNIAKIYFGAAQYDTDCWGKYMLVK
jgi:hypothetical protein